MHIAQGSMKGGSMQGSMHARLTRSAPLGREIDNGQLLASYTYDTTGGCSQEGAMHDDTGN